MMGGACERRSPPAEGATAAAANPNAEAAAAAKARGSDHFKKHDFQKALDAYTEAVTLDSRDASLWLNRAIVNRQLKNWEDAADDAEIASELQPTNSKAHYSRALALQQLGRLDEAMVSCKAGIAVDKENKALAQLKLNIERDIAAKDKATKEEASAKAKETRESVDVGNPQDVGGIAEEQPKKADKKATAKKKPATKKAEPKKDVSDMCPVDRLDEKIMQKVKEQTGEYVWRGENPSDEARWSYKNALTSMFKQKYDELREEAEKHKKTAKNTLATQQYEKEQKMGLQLKGGHQHLPRPTDVKLPADFRGAVGTLSLEDLAAYKSSNADGRLLLSVYGNLFDVSDRPDKYGPDGPYCDLTGSDITWGLFAGVDTADYCNKCYDLFKAKDLGKDKMAGVCSWLAWYMTEYGDAVGRLEPYDRERELPAPPLEEMDDACSVM